jgi:hypothetical protein
MVTAADFQELCSSVAAIARHLQQVALGAHGLSAPDELKAIADRVDALGAQARSRGEEA